MADPPWDIHMELPYGTMSDDEMRHLPVQKLQDEGLIFLWVTGRAMELGRECLKIWGYERVDEIIWVKTNQLQRIIRTGRTGHWLNHGKEHCLVGLKGKCIEFFQRVNFPFLTLHLNQKLIKLSVKSTTYISVNSQMGFCRSIYNSKDFFVICELAIVLPGRQKLGTIQGKLH